MTEQNTPLVHVTWITSTGSLTPTVIPHTEEAFHALIGERPQVISHGQHTLHFTTNQDHPLNPVATATAHHLGINTTPLRGPAVISGPHTTPNHTTNT